MVADSEAGGEVELTLPWQVLSPRNPEGIPMVSEGAGCGGS